MINRVKCSRAVTKDCCCFLRISSVSCISAVVTPLFLRYLFWVSAISLLLSKWSYSLFWIIFSRIILMEHKMPTGLYPATWNLESLSVISFSRGDTCWASRTFGDTCFGNTCLLLNEVVVLPSSIFGLSIHPGPLRPNSSNL